MRVSHGKDIIHIEVYIEKLKGYFFDLTIFVDRLRSICIYLHLFVLEGGLNEIENIC